MALWSTENCGPTRPIKAALSHGLATSFLCSRCNRDCHSRRGPIQPCEEVQPLQQGLSLTTWAHTTMRGGAAAATGTVTHDVGPYNHARRCSRCNRDCHSRRGPIQPCEEVQPLQQGLSLTTWAHTTMRGGATIRH
ncbi:hypothetical protein RRG08_033381 [Elysia crispata]|uniref:Uncharacterized protein n=1 Tax=Elysia crispata TaxID=231223 RepID=A0AAE1D6H0_9GAST|nr:hypothetical protein RRG08_033381 [Elysia crispata]